MTKKYRIRTGIIIIIACVMCFSDRSFAAETNKDIEFLGRSLNTIVSRMSWLWIIFAKLAGELLTNKWVYGEILSLDVLLRKYWNIIKNVANFGLGFYFVYIVLKGLISSGKEGIEKTLKNSLLRLLVAGIGIQASRFLTAVIIDLSTITLSAAGSLPSMIISQNSSIEGSVKNSISNYFKSDGNKITHGELVKVGEKINQGSQNINFSEIELSVPKEQEKLIDAMMPQPEDISGPLYFIGFSILEIKNITSVNSSNLNGWKATIYNTIIQGGTTLIYGIEMIILSIVAVMRILYLWMFIILSPIAVLLRCIQKSGEKLGGKSDNFLSKFTDTISFETFLLNVFKPTIVVLGLGVTVIFASLMTNVITNSSTSFNYGGVSFNSTKDSKTNTKNEGDTTYTSVMDHNLFSVTLSNAGKTLLELVLSILTVILVYQIIKVAVTMGKGKDFVGSRINKLQDTVGDLLGSVPIIPVAGYDKQGMPTTNYIGASKVFGLGSENSLLDERIRRYDNKVREVNDRDSKIIKSWFNEDVGILTAEEMGKIQRAMGDTTNPGDNLLQAKGEIEKIKTEKGKGMTLKEGVWKEEFEKWLSFMEDKKEYITKDNGFKEKDKNIWIGMIDRWNKNEGKDRTLQNMFKEANSNLLDNMQAYVRFFLGDEFVSRFRKREDLEKLDISKQQGNTSPKKEGEVENESEDDKSGGEGTQTTGGGDTPTTGGEDTPTSPS